MSKRFESRIESIKTPIRLIKKGRLHLVYSLLFDFRANDQNGIPRQRAFQRSQCAILVCAPAILALTENFTPLSITLSYL